MALILMQFFCATTQEVKCCKIKEEEKISNYQKPISHKFDLSLYFCSFSNDTLLVLCGVDILQQYVQTIDLDYPAFLRIFLQNQDICYTLRMSKHLSCTIEVSVSFELS